MHKDSVIRNASRMLNIENNQKPKSLQIDG